MAVGLQLLILCAFLVGNFIGFRITLHLLKVTEDVNRRSMMLTGYFLVVQFVSGVFISLVGLNQFAGLVLAVVLFSFVLKRFLVLKTWQLIAIPVGVALLSSVVLGVSIGIVISLFGPIKMG